MPSRISVALIVLASVVAMSVTGCRSDAYYQARAAERARSFLLKEAAGLSAEEKYFITFNDPVFLISPIIGDKSFQKDSVINAPVLSDQLNQICVSWRLPGSDEWYLVYGASNGRMDFWYPERVIRKKFASPRISALENATNASRTYARNNLFGLMSVAEQNFIRFHFPAVYETNFELNFNPTGTADAETVEKSRKAAAGGTQYSLVWEMPGDRELTVFCGVGRAEMAGWRINFAGKTTAEELRKHTVRMIKQPEEYYRPFPAPYAKTEKPIPPAEKK